MSAQPLLSTTPTPLMLPVTALYDLIISENSLIRPWRRPIQAGVWVKTVILVLFVARGVGWQVVGWSVHLPLTHFHTFSPLSTKSILFDNILYLNWIPLAKLFGTKSFVWFFEDATKIMSNTEPGQRKEISPLCIRVWWEGFADCVNVFET